MWGNKLGWGIATGIVGFAIYVAYLIVQGGQVTPATGWVAATVKPLTLPATALSVVPLTTAQDAGTFYRTAIDDARTNAASYDALLNATRVDDAAVAARPGLAALQSAAQCTGMTLFHDSPDAIVGYDADKPPLAELEVVGKVASHLAMLYIRQGDLPDAGWYHAAVYSMGVKLFQERVDFAELTLGEEMMGLGSGGLLELAARQKNTPEVLSLNLVDTERLSHFDAEVQPVWQVVGTVDEATMAIHAGDMFQLAGDKAVDPMWRAEALLHLGRLRYDAARRADQVLARVVATQIAADPGQPPAVRLAAAAARDLTVEQYRMIH